VEEKQSMAVASVLQALGAAAQSALHQVEQSAANQPGDQPLSPQNTQRVKESADTLTKAAERVSRFQEESQSTPYRFIGLQAGRIVEQGLLPARGGLEQSVKGDRPLASLDAAAVSLRWTLKALAELEGQFTSLQEFKKAESLLAELKQAHQIFIEDMPRWLKPGDPTAGYQRSMLELEESAAKALQKMLERRREILKELGEVLAKRPELKARFFDQQRTTALVAREELLKLRELQQSLLASTEMTRARKDMQPHWQERLRQELREAAAGAVPALGSAQTWIPAEATVEDRELLRAAASNAVSALETAAHSPDAAGIQAALDSLRQWESALSDAERGSASLRLYADNRRADIDPLRRRLQRSQALREAIQSRRGSAALQVLQKSLCQESDAVAEQVLDLVSSAAEDGEKSEAALLRTTLASAVQRPQAQAAAALGKEHLAAAVEAQQKAVEGLSRSVDTLDRFAVALLQRLDRQKRVTKFDGTPPGLNDLLAALETERRARMNLGLSCRPNNVFLNTDWSEPEPKKNPENPEDRRQQARELQERLERLRQEARQAARAAAQAQHTASQQTARLLGQYETSPLAPGAATAAKRDPWNTIPSELRSSLLQEKAVHAPKRYEKGIAGYFERIARQPEETK
jgi:hypothetical protein